jgi:hypothetical protein
VTFRVTNDHQMTKSTWPKVHGNICSVFVFFFFFFLFVCFVCLFFETGFLCIALAVLELIL